MGRANVSMTNIPRRSPMGMPYRSPMGVFGRGSSGLFLLTGTQDIPGSRHTTHIYSLDSSFNVVSDGAGPDVASSATAAFTRFCLGGGKSNLYFADGIGKTIKVINSSFVVTATYSMPAFSGTLNSCAICGDDSDVYLSVSPVGLSTIVFHLDPTSSMNLISSTTLSISGLRCDGICFNGTTFWLNGIQGVTSQLYTLDSSLSLIGGPTSATPVGTQLGGLECNSTEAIITKGINSLVPNGGALYFDASPTQTGTQIIDATIATGIRSICGTF